MLDDLHVAHVSEKIFGCVVGGAQLHGLATRLVSVVIMQNCDGVIEEVVHPPEPVAHSGCALVYQEASHQE